MMIVGLLLDRRKQKRTTIFEAKIATFVHKRVSHKDFRGTEIEQRLKDQGKIWYLVSGSKTQPTSNVGF